MRFRWSTWLWIWAGWTLVGVFFGTTLWLNYVATGRESSLRASLTISLAEWWIWALLTPIPVWLAMRWPLAPRPTLAAVGVHLSAGLGVAFLKAQLERWARAWLFGVTPYLMPDNVIRHALMYAAIVGTTHALAYYRRSRERELEASRIEAQLHRARLDALEDQLRPHFLFNALNTIAEVVHEDVDKADRMIANLGDLLRGTLDREGPLIPLTDELAHAERYLAIELARYGDRLRVTVDVPDRLGAWLVPRLVLQPILENAVRHGVGSRPSGGWIGIRAVETGGVLQLVIEDDGQGLDAMPPGAGTDGVKESGIGLANTRARLDVLYQGRARVDLAPRAGGGTVVTLTIPAETP